MKVATGQPLIDGLNAMACKVRHRLWISSPFVGGWRATRCIVNVVWQQNSNIDVRLLTDTSNIGWLDPVTIQQFANHGAIKDLRGLHAKVFIVDDRALITSANLTRKAFTQRYEAGVFLDAQESTKVVNFFEEWWKVANDPPRGWIAKLVPKGKTQKKNKQDEPNSSAPRNLNTLPPLPQQPAHGTVGDYEVFRKRYQELAGIYRKVGRIWPKVPLYLEVDAFLNYLFHEAPGRPSNKYQQSKRPPRKLTPAQRLKDMKSQAAAFATFAKTKPGYMADRVKRSQTVRTLLNRSRIARLSRSEAKQVVDVFHCLGSRPHHKTNFLKSANNDLQTIKNQWQRVLYPNGSLEAAMHQCIRVLKGFGKSSVQELLGWFDPDKYPIRNLNSNAGLRYFGYDVSLR
jgi:hypothetical protein